MAQQTFQQAFSALRLVKDYKEVIRSPLENVTAAPLDQNLFVWHGNVRSSDGALGGVPIHFVLLFPSTYPAEPPQVRLFQPVPHPNVRRVAGAVAGGMAGGVPASARWRLGLWDCVPDKNTWSAAYSVLSVLVQLQAFLCLEDIDDYASDDALLTATSAAKTFTCPHCTHTLAAPHPTFPTHEDMCRARRCAQHDTTLVKRPTPRLHVGVPTNTSSGPAAVAVQQPAAAGCAPKAAAAPAKQAAAVAAAVTVKQPAEAQWVEVKDRRGKAAAAGLLQLPAAAAARGSATAAAAVGVATVNAFSVLTKQSLVKKAEASSTQPASCSKQPAAAAATAAVLAFAEPVLTKTAKKNLARKLKRQAGATGAPATAAASVAGGNSQGSASQAAVAASSSSSSPAGADTWTVVGSDSQSQPSQFGCPPSPSTAAATAAVDSPAKLPLQAQLAAVAGVAHKDLIASVKSQWQRDSAAAAGQPAGSHGCAAAAAACEDDADHQQTLLQSQQPMGLFSRLGRDELLLLLAPLAPADLAALSCSCRGLRAACSDGLLWQGLFRARYPAAPIVASRMSDWKHTYVLQASNVLSDLKCFYTRASFDEDILCLPLQYTVNPRTKSVDYIEAYPECIALSAYQAGVNRTSAQETIMAVLPLYITHDHFTRAQPHLARALKTLAPHLIGRGGTAPPTHAWLDVLATILNTTVVLLCDRGHAASDKAVWVYTAVHRLLLAMCEQYGLWGVVRQRLNTFLSSPAQRTKDACPNLGLVYPLLSLSREHPWQQVGAPLLQESMARGVLWMCKAQPGLEKLLSAGPAQGGGSAGNKSADGDSVTVASNGGGDSATVAKSEGGDSELLKMSWEGAKVSARLSLFNHAFLHLVGAPAGRSLGQVMDAADCLYGHPGPVVMRQVRRALDKILKVSCWTESFALLGMPMSEDKIACVLRAALKRSCAVGYTKPGMDYSQVQKSGVSKILLKGQTYTAPPNMKKIELTDRWQWRAHTGSRYLDASILLYAPPTHTSTSRHTCIETIDYRHTRSTHTAHPSAVTHSGDVMDYESNSGLHTVSINLEKLGPHIGEIFIVVSAFAGATLGDIVQPMVELKDPATGVSLCEYHLEQQGREVRERMSSVVMGRVYRGEGGSNGWRFQALGVVGRGAASDYEPIYETIRNGQW